MNRAPADVAAQQRLRLGRLGMAAVASAIAFGLACLVALAGYLPWRAALIYGGVVLALLAAFYAVLRSGLNLRLRDPSMTVPQVLAAGLATSYLVYAGPEAQAAFLAIYVIAFMFAMLTLDLRRLVLVAVGYVALYAAVIWLLARNQPGQIDVQRELFGLSAFAVFMAWLTVLGGYVARLRARLRKTHGDLEQALADAERAARVDPLTGCYNRRYAMEQLGIEGKRAARGGALSLCLIDVDHFKSINDGFGHEAGDDVLRALGAAMGSILRATDFLARFGGEEFLVVLSQTASVEALRVAERIRAAVERMPVPAALAGRRLTVSIGIAGHLVERPAEETLARADRALYCAKQEGRNRVVLAEP